MTRKDFVAIADAIALIEDQQKRAEVTWALANVCARTNPRFDRDRFVARIEARYQNKEK